MKRLLIVGAVLLITSAAQAEFTTKSNGSFESGIFECGITFNFPKDNDPDPIYKITVNVIFDDSNKLKSMEIIHASVRGKEYMRSDQYSNDALWQLPDRLDIRWKGVWRKNPMVSMLGHLWYDNQWRYEETQYKNNVLQMQVTSACRQVQFE